MSQVVALPFGVTMTPLIHYYFPYIEQPDVRLSLLEYSAALVATGLLVLTDEAPDLEPTALRCPQDGRLSRGSLQVAP